MSIRSLIAGLALSLALLGLIGRRLQFLRLLFELVQQSHEKVLGHVVGRRQARRNSSGAAKSPCRRLLRRRLK